MSGDVPEFNSPYLNHYLKSVEDTESPRIFHIWSAIFGISAALGRRCWFPFGANRIFPNQYILLVGTPGTRKSTAAGNPKSLLRRSTGVRFAPKDTGGQRQGLVKALAGNPEESKEYLGAAQLASQDTSMMSLMDLENVTNEPDPDLEIQDSRDKHVLALVADEFSRVIGQNNLSMLDFLGELYDGSDIDYETLKNSVRIKNPLLNLLACTTPVSIAHSMPPQAGGQGFLSRMILVYGAKKYKEVARPQEPDEESIGLVRETLRDLYNNFSGEFEETPDAQRYSVSLYGYALDISDSRFSYYNERRYTHLIKLSMCIAASRLSRVIEVADVDEAHRILRATERGMPDALGEFGMNPLAMLKQEILEQMRANQGPLTMEQIVAMFHRDARSHEITEVINDLIKLGQVRVNQIGKTGKQIMSAAFSKANTEDDMMSLLAEIK